MSKTKLAAIGMTLLACVVTAAVKTGYLPNVCPPAAPVSTGADAGVQ